MAAKVKFPKVVFVTEEKDGDENFFITHENVFEAAMSQSDNPAMVAEYRLHEVSSAKTIVQLNPVGRKK